MSRNFFTYKIVLGGLIFGLILSSCSSLEPPTPIGPLLVATKPALASVTALQVTPVVQFTLTSTAKPTSTSAPLPIITSTSTPGVICPASFFYPTAFLPDNVRLLGRTETGIRIINLVTRQEEQVLSTPSPVVTLGLSPDGQFLAIALNDNTIQLVRLSDKKLVNILAGHTDLITALKFSPDGTQLYSASHDTWIKVWDSLGNLLNSFQPLVLDGFPSEVLGIGLSPDGSRLGTISSEGPLQFWGLPGFKKVGEYAGSISGGYDGSEIIYSPDGKLLAAGLGGGGQISLWRLSDGALLWRGGLFALAFSPDSRYLAYSDQDSVGNNQVVLHSSDGKDDIRVFTGPMTFISKLVFSSDGSRLASATDSETWAWEVADGTVFYRRSIICP